jgi:hypothetical protein
MMQASQIAWTLLELKTTTSKGSFTFASHRLASTSCHNFSFKTLDSKDLALENAWSSLISFWPKDAAALTVLHSWSI